MATEPEVVVPQKKQPEGEPIKPTVVDGITVPKEEYDDLKRRAEASSQNFERLKKEQERTVELETELAELKVQVPSDFRDDRVDALSNELAEIRARQERADVIEQNPVLKGEWSEFEKFRADPENKGMSLKTAAKAFLVEKGLAGAPRKGLEQPTGGDRQPIQSGMTPEEAKRLRETDYKKYSEMVRKGQIKVS